ncbi:Beta protein [Asanoa hainanensis]|uniref:Beta protein n=1 Tax=Asanoa hainanensis TaxID=560556 RepID=A0A239P9P1_9ACTN|nr:Beta protein [Asanoa hainanensis]
MLYVPILKGRAGELLALDHLTDDQVRRVLPILEVPPRSGDPIRDAFHFSERARDRLAVAPVGIDVRHLDDPGDTWRHPITDIADDLGAFDVPVLPVIRLTDPPARLRRHGEAVHAQVNRAVVRLGSDELTFDDELLRRLDG